MAERVEAVEKARAVGRNMEEARAATDLGQQSNDREDSEPSAWVNEASVAATRIQALQRGKAVRHQLELKQAAAATTIANLAAAEATTAEDTTSPAPAESATAEVGGTKQTKEILEHPDQPSADSVMDPVVANMGLTEAEASCAAAKVQAMHRGNTARREVDAKKAAAIAELAAAEEAAAKAAEAEATHAEAEAAEIAATEVSAATKLQAVQRGRLARQAAVKQKEAAAAVAELASAEQEEAATRMQAMHRGRLARKVAAKQKAAAEAIAELAVVDEQVKVAAAIAAQRASAKALAREEAAATLVAEQSIAEKHITAANLEKAATVDRARQMELARQLIVGDKQTLVTNTDADVELIGKLQQAVTAADSQKVAQLLQLHNRVLTAAGAVGPDGHSPVWTCLNHRRDWEITLGEAANGVEAPKLQVLKRLCSAGCDVNYSQPGTQPPIHLALMFEADQASDIGMPALEMLLASGADVTRRDSLRSSEFPGGRTALEYADEVTTGKIKKPQLELIREKTDALKINCATLASRQRLAWTKAAQSAVTLVRNPAALHLLPTEQVGLAIHRTEDAYVVGREFVALRQQPVKEECSPRSSNLGRLQAGTLLSVQDVGDFKGRTRLKMKLLAEPEGAETRARFSVGWIFAVGFDSLPLVRRADGTDAARLEGRHWELHAAPVVVLREHKQKQT